MGFWDIFTGKKKAQRIADFITRDAVYIDVRTKAEYQNYHVPGTKNIPLAEFPSKLAQIKKQNRPVFLFCASGMRSASATASAKAAGVEVMNLGTFKKAEEILSN